MMDTALVHRESNVMDNAQVGRISSLGNSALQQPLNSVITGSIINVDPPQQPLAFSTPPQSSVKVTLIQEYLLNVIELEGFPNLIQRLNSCLPPITVGEIPVLSTNSPYLNERFSYIVRVSKSGKDWIELFNYSKYNCHHFQKLQFPTLAFK